MTKLFRNFLLLILAFFAIYFLSAIVFNWPWHFPFDIILNIVFYLLYAFVIFFGANQLINDYFKYKNVFRISLPLILLVLSSYFWVVLSLQSFMPEIIRQTSQELDLYVYTAMKYKEVNYKKVDMQGCIKWSNLNNRIIIESEKQAKDYIANTLPNNSNCDKTVFSQIDFNKKFLLIYFYTLLGSDKDTIKVYRDDKSKTIKVHVIIEHTSGMSLASLGMKHLILEFEKIPGYKVEVERLDL